MNPNLAHTSHSRRYSRGAFATHCSPVVKVCAVVAAAEDVEGVNLALIELRDSLNLKNILFFGQASTKKDFRLSFSSGSLKEKTYKLPNKIPCDHEFWEVLNNSPDNVLTSVKINDKDSDNVFVLKQRTENNTHTLLAIESTVEHQLDKLALLEHLGECLHQTWYRLRRNRDLDIESLALHHLLINTQESLAQLDKHGVWQYLNANIPTRLGYDESQAKKGNVFGNASIVTTEDWAQINNQLKTCITHKVRQQCIYSMQNAAGEWRTISATLLPSTTSNSTLLNAISVDITESVRLEKNALQESELEKWLIQQNRNLFNKHDRESINQVLHAFASRFSIARCYVAVKRESFASVYSQWQNETVAEVDQKYLSDLSIADVTKELIINNVAECWSQPGKPSLNSSIESSLIIPIGTGSSQTGWLVCDDLDPRMWSKLELRAARMIATTLSMVISKDKVHKDLESSRQQFQMALDAASYGLWELDISNQRIYVTPTYFAMLGYEAPNETEYRPLDVSNIHIDDQENVREHERKLMEGEITDVDYESRHIAKNGDIKWILTRGRVIKWDDTGKPLRALGTVSDITDLKKTQTDLQLAYQQAEAARVAKGEFLARMSHEIRTPMNAIIGMSYMLLKSKLEEQLQRDRIEDIERAAKSLLQIIDDILDFSKIEAGKLEIEHHNFNFRKQIDRVCSRYFEQAKERGLGFSVNFSSSVPHMLNADSTRIRQVLVNLLNNAFKFTNEGSISLDVDCPSKTTHERLVKFTIKDTGIGLNKDQITTLFDPFTQADGSRTRQYGGTGLGLAICKLLIDKMDGQIEVDSDLNKGSVFTFTVKCRPTSRRTLDNINHDENDQPPTLGNNKMSGQKPLKVLLVEDNKVNQKVAVGMLQHLGINTAVANNGTEAVYMMKACESGEFDLVFMDIEMPFMGGFEATSAIRRIDRHQNVPIIAMTAHIVDGDLQRYLNAGMNDCISKPIAPATLAQVLQTNTMANALPAKSGDQLH